MSSSLDHGSAPHALEYTWRRSQIIGCELPFDRNFRSGSVASMDTGTQMENGRLQLTLAKYWLIPHEYPINNQCKAREEEKSYQCTFARSLFIQQAGG